MLRSTRATDGRRRYADDGDARFAEWLAAQAEVEAQRPVRATPTANSC